MSVFNEDEYRDNQLNKYLDEVDGDCSNCCNAPIIENTDICSDCEEHSETMTEVYESAMEDRADAQRELEREQND